MPKISRRVLYGGIAAIAVAAFLLTAEEAPEGKGVAARPKAKAPARTQATAFTEEDYSAKFVSLNTEVRNAFKPLVVRAPSTSLGGGPAWDGREVPSDIVGGGNWIYTGMAEVDGVPMALVENRASGDTRFLRQGERWSNASVYRITPESLVLLHRGELVTIRMQGFDEPTPMNSGFAPMQVPPGSLPSGSIGGQVTVVPDQQQSANEGRRRRNNPAGATSSGSNDPMIGEWSDEN